MAHANTTNTIVVQVSDNNVPSLTPTQSFKVVVNPLASVTLGPLTATPGNARIEVNGPIGPDYILQATTRLTNGSWISLLTNSPSSSPFTLTDSPFKFCGSRTQEGLGLRGDHRLSKFNSVEHARTPQLLHRSIAILRVEWHTAALL